MQGCAQSWRFRWRKKQNRKTLLKGFSNLGKEMRTLENTIVVNPEWEHAKHEFNYRDQSSGTFRIAKFPLRWNGVKDGKIVPIQPFITLAEAAKNHLKSE